jgi:hypothetical protein
VAYIVRCWQRVQVTGSQRKLRLRRQKQPRRLAEEGYGTCDASYRTAGHAVSLQHSRLCILGDLRRNNSPDDDCLRADNSWFADLNLAGYDSCTTLFRVSQHSFAIDVPCQLPRSSVLIICVTTSFHASLALVRSVVFAIRELYPRTRHSSYQSKAVGGSSLQSFCTTSGSRVRRDRPLPRSRSCTADARVRMRI